MRGTRRASAVVMRNTTIANNTEWTDAQRYLLLGAAVVAGAVAATLLYRRLRPTGDTRASLGGRRGTNVFETIIVDAPVETVYRAWRRLQDLPLFMSHLESVTDTGSGRSHWVVSGPAGVRVE